jgi:DNA-binding transcriptional MocR family regulator
MGQFMDIDAVCSGWARGPGSKAQRLTAVLERALIDGEIEGPLPSERRLAAQLGLSRGTVAAAYGLLKERRRLTSRPGGYTRPDTENLKAPARAARLAARGTAPGTTLGTYVDPDPAALNLSLAVLGVPGEMLETVRSAYRRAADCSAFTAARPAGHPELRERIAATYRAIGLGTEAEQIVVTQGARQGIVLATMLAVQPGDRVACECPIYPGALDIFRAHSAALHNVTSFEDPDVLAALERKPNIAMIYASSVYRNPTGSITSRSTAARLVRLARAHDILTVDDRALENCGFDSEIIVPLAAYDLDAPILTLGSLDKTTGAGARIGWIRAPRPLVGKIARLKALLDLTSPALTQGLAIALLEHLEPLAAARRRELAERYAAVTRALADAVPGWTYRAQRGGSSLWIDTHMDADVVVRAAAEVGVTLMDGRAFDPTGTAGRHIRIALARSPAELTTGIRRVAAALA